MKTKKQISFYSYNGTNIPTLAALAYFKPKNVVINWFVHAPEGPINSEFFDSILGMEQIGYDFNYGIKNSLWKIKNYLIAKKIQKYLRPKAKYRLTQKDVNIIIVGSNWQEALLNDSSDAVVLSSIRPGEYAFYKKLVSLRPIFLHEYGNTLKNNSAFDFFKERHEVVTAIFCPGTRYQKQLRSRKINVSSFVTGASKTDFYQLPPIFPRPIKAKYLVYCNSVSHISIYDSATSQPQKWIDILTKSCRRAGYELVVKLHPHTYFIYNQTSWANQVYFNSISSDLFKQAAGIISDPSSLMLESLLVDKPLFYPKQEFSSWSNLKPVLKIGHELTDNVELNAGVITKAIAEFKTTSAMKALKEEYWYQADGHVSERIWNNIMKVI